ncbi:MAG: AMP-binding protein [Candidatus Obscuribacterales bacterium]|nr:AMP-binding protein [Candidatus Obscuribacterales bacterium]
MRTAVVLGAGGFIGSHLVKRLKAEGYWVRGVDLKYPEFSKSQADEFVIGDLREQSVCRAVIERAFDEVYQLAADMGGAGYIFTGENDANVMHNSASINLNVLHQCHLKNVGKIFYSSSACIYPAYNQEDPDNPKCSEDSAYPAMPDSEYGWEKLFSERLYLSYARNFGMQVRIGRFHNIFGEEGTWRGGKEKAPAAICRKIAEAEDGGTIEIWGDGKQTRSFLYINECLEGVRRLMQSDFSGPVNIGSEEMVTINKLAEMVMQIADKHPQVKHIPGPLGVRGRNSDNKVLREKLNWAPTSPLSAGLERTYQWIFEQIEIEKSRSSLPEALDYASKKYAKNPALISDSERLTYEELHTLSMNFAAHLEKLGISENQKVAVLIPTSWQFVAASLGCISNAACYLPLDPEIGADTLNHVLKSCPPSALIIDQRILNRFDWLSEKLSKETLIVCDIGRNAREEAPQGSFEKIVSLKNKSGQNFKPKKACSENDLVSVTFTSGSTGSPKGVMHSHRSWMESAISSSEYFGIGPGDSMLLGLPLAHAYSFRHLLAYLLSGGSLVLARDFLSALKLLESERPNALLMVPSAINILIKQFASLLSKSSSHLKLISIGTAAIEDEQLEQLRRLAPGAALHLPYGLTEARVGFLELSKPRTLKQLCRGIKLSLRSSAGELCQTGDTGEIFLEGDGVMLGYWGWAPEQFKEIRDNGFATGDMGRLEPDGRISLMGRLDEMVNVGGKKVSPIELESVLALHPRIVEAAVFGSVDESGLMGQKLVAIVVPEANAQLSSDEILDYLKQHLEQYKIPSVICIKDKLPKSSTGKILKVQLRESLEAESIRN